MGAPVRVEDEAFSDPRIALLGEIAGYNAFEALGRMTHLWRVCTHKQTYYATEVTVKACLGPNGVAALIGSELGDMTDGVIRVRGTEGRIEWLGKRRRASDAGGEATKAKAKAAKSTNAEAKPRKSKAKTSNQEAKPEPNDSQTEAKAGPHEGQTTAKTWPNRGPLTLTLPLSTSQTTETTAAPSVVVGSNSDQSGPIPDTPVDPPKSRPPSPHKQAMNIFDEYFMAANGGEPPSWDAANTLTARKTLDKARGRVEEFRRRTHILYTAAPDWLKPPYDINTLHSNFDKLVSPSAPPTGRRTVDRPGAPSEAL